MECVLIINFTFLYDEMEANEAQHHCGELDSSGRKAEHSLTDITKHIIDALTFKPTHIQLLKRGQGGILLAS